MTTVLNARPRGFVSTPAIERIIARALRYLQSGFPVHLRGPAGTGKTTLALHLADLLSRPIMLLFGDDEFKSTDLIGNQSGYTRKKVVDNFIHSVVKMEDELRHNWVDSRLTLACREGFTLVYDEFNRSRPEVNNVLLSALEEKLLVLPPNSNRNEYIRVNPHFRAIFTSNPEEYCGVHATQDALLDRLITINVPEPDELAQQEIIAQKIGIDRQSAATIVQLVRRFRNKANLENSSGLRSCLMISKICHEHGVVAGTENAEFRDLCQDILLSRSGLPIRQATQLVWETFNELVGVNFTPEETADHLIAPYAPPMEDGAGTDKLPSAAEPQLIVPNLGVQNSSETHESESQADEPIAILTPDAFEESEATHQDVAAIASKLDAHSKSIVLESDKTVESADVETSTDVNISDIAEDQDSPEESVVEGELELESKSPDSTLDIAAEHATHAELTGTAMTVDGLNDKAIALSAPSDVDDPVLEEFSEVPFERDVYAYLQTTQKARPSEVEVALKISRFQAINALRSLLDKGLILTQSSTNKPSVYCLNTSVPATASM